MQTLEMKFRVAGTAEPSPGCSLATYYAVMARMVTWPPVRTSHGLGSMRRPRSSTCMARHVAGQAAQAIRWSVPSAAGQVHRNAGRAAPGADVHRARRQASPGDLNPEPDVQREQQPKQLNAHAPCETQSQAQQWPRQAVVAPGEATHDTARHSSRQSTTAGTLDKAKLSATGLIAEFAQEPVRTWPR